MKKKTVLIILAIVAVVAIGAGIVGGMVWYYSPGIHVVGPFARLDVQRTAFAIDGETGKVIAQTVIEIEGSSTSSRSSKFDGVVKVAKYQNYATGTVTGDSSKEKTASGFYVLHYIETCTHYAENDGITKAEQHYMDYLYAAYLHPDHPDFLMVDVDNLNDEAKIYVVAADSEAEALEQYRWFILNK